MKKLMTALTICAVASFATAAVDVTSPNIVGYKTATVASGEWTMLATPFVQVGGALTNGVNSVVKGTFADGDEIYVWDSSIQDYRALIWTTDAMDEAFENVIGTGWADAGVYSFLPLGVGQGFFIRAAMGAVAPTLVGQVPSGVTLTMASGQWSMVCVPYPVSTLVNTPTWGGFADNDEIYVWDNAIQDYRALIWTTDAMDEAFENVIGTGWADAGVYSYLPLHIGGAAFIQKLSAGAGTLAY